jgi:DNA replication protein DnaC
MEVLFTFLADRYERRSVIIISNLVFSQWARIFKDPMTTATAIDQLVNHCVILELTGPSYRTEKTLNKKHVLEITSDGSNDPYPAPGTGNYSDCQK